MTALAVTALVIAMMFVPALADAGSYARTRAEAQAAADSGALAAAQEITRGGDPAAAAKRYAGEYGAAVASVETGDGWVVVTARKACGAELAARFGVFPKPVVVKGKAEILDADEPDY